MMFTIHIGKVIKELWVLTACKSTGIRRIAGLASIAAGQSVTSEKSKKKKGNEKCDLRKILSGAGQPLPIRWKAELMTMEKD